jgi:hypothetical protein
LKTRELTTVAEMLNNELMRFLYPNRLINEAYLKTWFPPLQTTGGIEE